VLFGKLTRVSALQDDERNVIKSQQMQRALCVPKKNLWKKIFFLKFKKVQVFFFQKKNFTLQLYFRFRIQYESLRKGIDTPANRHADRERKRERVRETSTATATDTEIETRRVEEKVCVCERERHTDSAHKGGRGGGGEGPGGGERSETRETFRKLLRERARTREIKREDKEREIKRERPFEFLPLSS